MTQTKRNPNLERTLEAILAGEPSSTRHRIHTTSLSDPADEAQLIGDTAVAVEELDVAWRTRKQARAALDRLRTGRYGLCTTCGREIGAGRLDALPWATRCVRCAELFERAAGGDGQTAPLRAWLDGSPDAA